MFTVQYRSVGISQSCFVTWWFQRALNAAGLVAHRAMATTFHFDGEFVRAQEHEAEGIVLYDPRQHSSLALPSFYVGARLGLCRLALSLPPSGAIDASAGAGNQQARSLELRAAMSLGRLWQRQGKRAAAHELLAAIYGWFSEGFETADLREAKALLKALG